MDVRFEGGAKMIRYWIKLCQVLDVLWGIPVSLYYSIRGGCDERRST
jgi:hypothetical protein